MSWLRADVIAIVCFSSFFFYTYVQVKNLPWSWDSNSLWDGGTLLPRMLRIIGLLVKFARFTADWKNCLHPFSSYDLGHGTQRPINRTDVKGKIC